MPAKDSYAARTITWPPVTVEQAQRARGKVNGDFTLMALPQNSKAEALRAQAMQKALTQAREKAGGMAAVLGAKLGNVWTITELPEAGAAGEPPAPGTMQFTARAEVSFALQ